jgi:hypothetical protein
MDHSLEVTYPLWAHIPFLSLLNSVLCKIRQKFRSKGFQFISRLDQVDKLDKGVECPKLKLVTQKKTQAVVRTYKGEQQYYVISKYISEFVAKWELKVYIMHFHVLSE